MLLKPERSDTERGSNEIFVSSCDAMVHRDRLCRACARNDDVLFIDGNLVSASSCADDRYKPYVTELLT